MPVPAEAKNMQDECGHNLEYQTITFTMNDSDLLS
jgi:hypothetical protein